MVAGSGFRCVTMASEAPDRGRSVGHGDGETLAVPGAATTVTVVWETDCWPLASVIGEGCRVGAGVV